MRIATLNNIKFFHSFIDVGIGMYEGGSRLILGWLVGVFLLNKCRVNISSILQLRAFKVVESYPPLSYFIFSTSNGLGYCDQHMEVQPWLWLIGHHQLRLHERHVLRSC